MRWPVVEPTIWLVVVGAMISMAMIAAGVCLILSL